MRERGIEIVDVKDKNVLKQIKEIGQGQFSKSWKDKMLDTVRLEPSKNLITSYAEATGQNTAKLTLEKRRLDPNDPTNRYELPIVPRENGGRVWPGQDFLVGERRAEVVRFDRPATIYPSVEAYQQGNGRSTGNGGGLPAGLVQALVQMIGQLHGELARIGSIPPDQILMRNAEAVANAANAGQRGSGYALNTLSEVYG